MASPTIKPRSSIFFSSQQAERKVNITNITPTDSSRLPIAFHLSNFCHNGQNKHHQYRIRNNCITHHHFENRYLRQFLRKHCNKVNDRRQNKNNFEFRSNRKNRCQSENRNIECERCCIENSHNPNNEKNRFKPFKKLARNFNTFSQFNGRIKQISSRRISVHSDTKHKKQHVNND